MKRVWSSLDPLRALLISSQLSFADLADESSSVCEHSLYMIKFFRIPRSKNHKKLSSIHEEVEEEANKNAASSGGETTRVDLRIPERDSHTRTRTNTQKCARFHL